MDSLNLQLTADGSYTLGRGSKNETYHSKNGAVTESKEVFLRNSGVQLRLEQGKATNVLEIGFGTGLNFLLTSQCARKNNCALSYTAYELYPPPAELIRQLLTKNTSSSAREIDSVLKLYNNRSTRVPTAINAVVDLSLRVSDVLLSTLPSSEFHAVYLDAFSQSEAPDFWKTAFLKKLHDALRPGGRLATYSVNRPFRDSLAESGFDWQKLPGPAGKREVLIATR